MLHTFKGLLRKPPTIIGLIMAFAFQIIFCVVWMTGYSGVNDRVKDFHIAIVNEAGATGQAISQQLASKLPFQIKEEKAQQAADLLNSRDVQMIVTIPSGFKEALTTPGTEAKLQFTINESNPVTIKSVMQNTANQIAESVNRNAAGQGTTAVLEQLHLPATQATATSQALQNKVSADLIYTNKVDGMNNQMVPMMLVLASFVGAMIMGMNVQQGAAIMAKFANKWSIFISRSVLNLITAVVVSLVGSTLVVLLGGQTAHGFLGLWLFLSLFLATFMLFSQMFLMVFGMAGMLVNAIMLSLQLVSSGAMVPRSLLSSTFQTIGDFLPATYAVEGLMNLQFGGPGVGPDVTALVIVSGVSLVISAIAVALHKSNPLPLPLESTDIAEPATI